MFFEEGVSNAGLRYDVLDVGDPPARFSKTYMLDHSFWLTWSFRHQLCAVYNSKGATYLIVLL